MIEVTVNGDTLQIVPLSTVRDLVQKMSLQGKRIAIEVNGEIVPASQHDSHTLSAGDRVEIVGAIGGG